jgi:4-hydroxybenzoate polyprenyltransferase
MSTSCSRHSPHEPEEADHMIWVLTALALVLWLVGVLLRVGQWVNLLLLLAAVLLVYQVIEERRARRD